MPRAGPNPVALVLGSILILLGCAVAVVFLAVLRRRARAFPCPECNFPISTEAIELEGITCPACGWQVRRKEPGEPLSGCPAEVPLGTLCHRCGAPSGAGGAVRLWDGEVYCRDCLDAACPRLAQYAEENSEIAELWSVSAWQVGAGLFLLLTAFIAVLAGWRAGFLRFLLVLGPCFGVYFLFVSVLLARASKSSEASVVVRDGQLFTRSRRGEEVPGAPLGDCRWFVGDTSLMKPLVPFTLGHPALLIAFKPEKRRRTVVAVGHTPETRQIWEAFLTLAGVPQRPPRFGHIGVKAVLDWVFALLILPASFVAGAIPAKFIDRLVREASGDLDFAENASAACFLSGMGIAFFGLVWCWHWAFGPRPEALGLTLRPAEERRKETRQMVVWVTILFTLLLGIFRLLQPMSPLARWGGLAFFLVCGCLLGVAFGLVGSKYKVEDEDEPENGPS